MNYLIEGLQGSGKSTLTGLLKEKLPECKVYLEGDYSPIELAWCALVSKETYNEILAKYPDLKEQIEEKSHEEDGYMVVCYTKVRTDNTDFYKDLEQYEIYNGRKSLDEFRKIILSRYKKWNGDNGIFECSLFQNTIEDMILFRAASDREILDLYKEIRAALDGKDLHIYYLKADDIAANLSVIRKERSDDQGNELWFPMMMQFFDNSVYAKKNGVSGEEELIRHWAHRQELELKILGALFDGKYTVLKSKGYTENEL